jgi:hypothetical protein
VVDKADRLQITPPGVQQVVVQQADLVVQVVQVDLEQHQTYQVLVVVVHLVAT